MKKSYKTHFRAAFLVVLCLLFVTSVSAALSGFTQIGQLNFTNTTRINELQFINLSYISGGSNYNLCSKINLSDLRITEQINETTETNLSYEFIGINHTQKTGYSIPGHALIIVSNTSNTVNIYCNNPAAINVNTTIISAYDYFKYTVTKNLPYADISSYLLWTIGSAERLFTNSGNFGGIGDRDSLGLTRYSNFNPQIQLSNLATGTSTYTSPLSKSTPIFISVKTYRTLGAPPTNFSGLGLVVSNEVTTTDHASDVGIIMSNKYNVTYDCSNSTETYINSTIPILDNVTHTAAMRIYSNYTELYWDNFLVTNCTTNPVHLSQINQIRISGGVINGNTQLTLDGLYMGEFKAGNTFFKPYTSENNISTYFKTFVITYLDEITGNIINNTNITTYLYNDTSSTKFTTTNGIINLGMLPYGVINIRSTAAGYNTRFSSYNITGNSSINVYLLNSSGTNVADVTMNVIDNSGSPVYNAYISILKYNYTTGAFETVTTLSTGTFGSVVDSLVYNTEFYKFYVYYPYGTIRLVTQPSLIYSDVLTFQINIGGGLNYLYDTISGISYDYYVYNNNSCYLELLDLPAEVTSIKHDIYRTYNGYEVLEDTDTITSPVTGWSNAYSFSTNNDTTIRCVFTAYVNGNQSTVSILNFQNPKSRPFGSLGMFFLILITLVVLFIGYFSLNLAIILAPLPLLVFSAIGIVDISTPICIVMEIAAIIVASMVRD